MEQKNCQVARRFVGYDRFEGLESCRRFSELYKRIRLYVNFFQPSMKLLEKHRDGSKVCKRYDKAKTPYQRIMDSPLIVENVKIVLKQQYNSLDPVRLLVEVGEKQDLLWQRAWVSADSDAIDINTSVEMHSNPGDAPHSDEPQKIITEEIGIILEPENV